MRQVSFRLFGTTFNENENISVADAFDAAGLNFNVETEHLIRVPSHVAEAIQNGQTPLWTPKENCLITSHKATTRQDTDTTLGVVGADYGVVQNSNAFGFFDFLEEVSGTAPSIVSAGALGYGERIFLCARMGEDTYLNPNDAVENYVVFTNGHDGRGALMAFFTPIRVVCQNTLNMAIKGAANKITFKHTKYVGQRVDWENEMNRKRAYEVFAKSVDFSKHFVDAMQKLSAQSVSAQQTDDFVAQMILNPAQFRLYRENGRNAEKIDEISTRSQNLMVSLKNSIESGIGQDMGRGTKAWLLNGVTTWLHNGKTWKSAEDEFKSLMDGDGAKKTQKAYDLLMAA